MYLVLKLLPDYFPIILFFKEHNTDCLFFNQKLRGVGGWSLSKEVGKLLEDAPDVEWLRMIGDCLGLGVKPCILRGKAAGCGGG